MTMAYGDNGDDDYHLGMYNMISGVQVKIGEKFKLPERISLPVGWQRCDPSSLVFSQYDFWKENEVISQANEERRIQEELKNGIEESANEIDTTAENITDDEEPDYENTANSSSDSNTNEILTPLVLTSEGVENKLDVAQNKINVEEFEDQNQNPFESVELQTLDEIDELRSVLDPSAKGKKVIKSKKDSKACENFELDVNFFKNVNPAQPVASLASENYVPNYSEALTTNVNESTDTLTPGFDIPNHTAPAFDIPNHTAKGTLNWTRFNKDTLPYPKNNQSGSPACVTNIDQIQNSVSNMQISGQASLASNQIHLSNSETNVASNAMSRYVSSGTNNSSVTATSMCNGLFSNETAVSNESRAGGVPFSQVSQVPQVPQNLSYGQMLFMNDGLQPIASSSKSMPDLHASTDQQSRISSEVQPSVSNCVPPAGGVRVPDQMQHMNMYRAQVDNVVRTDRIDSIMKQYQFQRLQNVPGTPNFNPANNFPVSNVGGNTTNLPSITPRCTASMSNIPAESFSVPLPFSLTDIPSSTHSTAAYNPPNNVMPLNSVSSSEYQNNRNSFPLTPPNPSLPSSSMYQGMPVSNPNVPASCMNIPMGFPPPNNPFFQSNTENQNTSQVPTSFYKHGVLPPIPTERTHLPSNMNPSQMTGYEPPYPVIGGSQSNETPSSSSANRPPQQQVSSHSIHPHMNIMTELPPIPSQQQLSWLVDPTEELVSNQRNFAYQLSAMGFYLPCVSRTVLRLGIDEKEVLDFLCKVQELKEDKFHSDDVEMALVNLQNEKEKVSSYLQMVNTLRELGFQPSEIHNALVKTSVDQNKAIDYLTSSR